MARNHAVAATPADVLTIINGAGIVDTSLWYYSPRLSMSETNTHTYTNYNVVPLADITTIANDDNLSDLILED